MRGHLYTGASLLSSCWLLPQRTLTLISAGYVIRRFLRYALNCQAVLVYSAHPTVNSLGLLGASRIG